MSSRERILAAIATAQGEEKPLPPIVTFSNGHNVVDRFTEVLHSIGGTVLEADNREAAMGKLQEQFAGAHRVVYAREDAGFLSAENCSPHSLGDVDLAIVDGKFGVAENGAVWITDANLPQRVLPFIAQHLAIFLYKEHLVATMHDAYQRIGDADYGFGVFIAGPSKTADIEQSLVLGAHGARSMIVCLLDR